MLRQLAVLVCVVSVAIGCGQADDTRSAAREASGETTIRRSWRVLETEMLGGERSVRRGIVDADRKRTHYVVDLGPAPPDAEPWEVRDGRLIGEEIQVGSFAYLGGALAEGDKPWIRVEAGELDSETMADDAAAELEQLRHVGDDFQRVGEDVIRGKAAVHYRGTVDIGAVSGTWELWVGEGRVLRARFTDREGDATTTTEFFDFGVTAKIEPPPAELVGVKPPPHQNCAGEPTRPVTAERLVQALRRNGFTVSRDPDDVLCGSEHPAEDVPFGVSNIDEPEAVTDQQGLVFCSLRRRPIYGGGTQIEVMDDEREKKKLVLANAECSVYTRGRRGADQIGNLEGALKELQAELRSG